MNTEFTLALLRVIDPDGSEHVLSITHSPFCIGHAERNDLPLVDAAVSRHHACLRLNGDQMLVVDMGSEHGTWVGATRLEVNEPRALDYHEIFRIGPYHLRLEPVTAATLPPGLIDEAVCRAPTVERARSIGRDRWTGRAGHGRSLSRPDRTVGRAEQRPPTRRAIEHARSQRRRRATPSMCHWWSPIRIPPPTGFTSPCRAFQINGGRLPRRSSNWPLARTRPST